MTEEAKITTPIPLRPESPIKLVRRPDWAARFTRYLVESRREGVRCDWEFFHCAGWVTTGIEEMTGVDLMEPFGTLTTAEDAYKAIRKAGYKDFDEVVRTFFAEKPVIEAKRGDVLLIPAQGAEYQGLGMSHAMAFADPPFYWALGSAGVGKGNLLDAVAAFSVGDI